jgi:hypothetical protein
MSLECTFNQEGFCVAEQEFEGWQCPLKDDKGHCTAKPEQLDYCCPYCGEGDCDEECGDCEDSKLEDVAVVPKSSLNRNKKAK